MSSGLEDVLVVVAALVLVFGLPLVSALILALALGRSWLRLLAVAAIGPVVLGAAAIVSLVTDCEGCAPEIGVSLAAFALAAWLVGLVVAVVVRLFTSRRPGRVATLLAVALLVPVLGVVGAGRRSIELTRLGCPTQEDFERAQSVDDVVEAFEDAGMPLERIPLPPLPKAGPGYRGAVAFRHEIPGATLFVVVCRRRCAVTYFPPPPGERIRAGLDPSNNVPIWITQSDPRAGRRLSDALGEPLDDVHPGVEHGSRCYIN